MTGRSIDADGIRMPGVGVGSSAGRIDLETRASSSGITSRSGIGQAVIQALDRHRFVPS